MQNDKEAAMSDALRLLAFRPRSTAEMKKRLKMRGRSAETVEATVRTLTEKGLLDDAKFAKLFAGNRMFTRPSGKRQLEFELTRLGVDKRIVTETIAGLEGYDEKNAARQLVSVRAAKMSGVPVEKRKARLYGFLKRRGFPNNVIFEVLGEVFHDDDR